MKSWVPGVSLGYRNFQALDLSPYANIQHTMAAIRIQPLLLFCQLLQILGCHLEPLTITSGAMAPSDFVRKCREITRYPY